MDFELTDDGDLYLGQQQIDEDGYLLYYKTDPDRFFNPIVVRDASQASIPIRDFKTISGDVEKVQLVHNRLRTENPDWLLYEYVGASLSDFIGEPNNPQTAEAIERRVLHTLKRNSAFMEEELTINVAPISISEVLIDVRVESENNYINYAFSLSFLSGVTNTYVIDEEGHIVQQEKINPEVFEGILEGGEIE